MFNEVHKGNCIHNILSNIPARDKSSLVWMHQFYQKGANMSVKHMREDFVIHVQ